MTIGVLALQGDVREHEAALAAVGATTRRVLQPADLAGLAGLVLPGGESTTLSMLLTSSGLFDPVSAAIADGVPVFGTCAGMILLARRVEDGRPDQRSFQALDCTVRRNGYGRQRFSFEAVAEPAGALAGTRETGGSVPGVAEPLPAVFIRAPVIVEVAEGVEVLATLRDAPTTGRPQPVVCRQGSILAATYHPELTSDLRLHRLFLAMSEGVGSRSAAPADAAC